MSFLWGEGKGGCGMITHLQGDCRDILPTLPADSFDCVVTSPPYWGLRDYGVDGQIGLEPTLDAYLETMVGVCRELRRVLKPTGTFWLNIGDSYNAHPGQRKTTDAAGPKQVSNAGALSAPSRSTSWLKPKDLCMVPNRLAIALQDDGWYVRSEIIWHKPNPMPESVTDRPTSSHEKVWLLTKGERYFYDAAAISEPFVLPRGGRTIARGVHGSSQARSVSGQADRSNIGGFTRTNDMRNARNVWSIATQPFKGSHFATMPPELVERCVLAGSPKGGLVLDPFGGAGTTGLVADRFGRNATLIELNPAYFDMSKRRISDDAPLFAEVK